MSITTHDITMGYGGLLVVGGLMGFIASGSVGSLLFGGATGGILIGLGFLSKKDFLENTDKKFKSATYSYLIGCFLVSLLVTLVMGERTWKTGKIFPPGVVAGISSCMLVFYIYKLSSDDVGSNASRTSRRQ